MITNVIAVESLCKCKEQCTYDQEIGWNVQK